MSVADDFNDRLSQIEAAILDAAREWVDAAAQTVKAAVREDWPSPDRNPPHIYATGRSQDAFEVRPVSEYVAEVVNTAERRGENYSGYVDGGYTRYGGAGSANPYQARGGKDYSQQTVERMEQPLRDDLERRINEKTR